MTMTAFITRCWKNAWPETRAWLLCVCLGGGVLTPAWAQAGAEVSDLRVERAGDALALSASVRFDLPAVVEDALRKGVPVFFVMEADLVRERWYWMDKRFVTATRQMRLLFHPLTQRWRLGVAPAGAATATPSAYLSRNFDTLDDALAAVKRITGWRIADAADVDAEARQRVDFRFRLDVSQLPRPLQIGVLGQSDWNISVMASKRLTPEGAR